MATFKYVDLVGTSPESWEAAAQEAVSEAAKSLKDIYWIEVVEQRAKVENGRISEFQTALRAAHKVEVEPHLQ